MNLFRHGLYSAFILTWMLCGTAATADDVITLKSGDRIWGTVLEQKFGNYVQLRMLDKNERRIPWADISSIDKQDPPIEPTEKVVTVTPAVAPNLEPESAKFALELIGLSYISYWHKQELIDDEGDSVGTSSEVDRRTETVPLALGFRIEHKRWSVLARTSARKNQTQGMFALAFEVVEPLEFGLGFKFSRTDITTRLANGDESRDAASDYIYGIYTRLELPVAARNILELSVVGGIDFIDLVNRSEVSGSVDEIGGSGRTFTGFASLFSVFELSPRFFYMLGIQGSFNTGTINGAVVTAGTSVTGKLKVSNSQFEFIPAMVRIVF